MIASPRVSNDRIIANQRWRDYEYNTGQTLLRSMPDIFAIESTNYCNLKCVMCPRGEPDIMERSLGVMDGDLFEKIVAQWEFFKEPCWFHWFGEPLMHRRLFEQIEYAKRVGVRNLGISSNATLLTMEKSAAILDSGLDSILLCIDGNNKETYEAIRKSAAFTYEEVCDNVEKFLAMRKRFNIKHPHTTVQIIVMEETKDQLEGFREKWMAAGADQVLFKLYTAWGNQEDERFVDLAPEAQRQYLVARKRPHPCFYMWDSVVIAWDGRVVPCCFDYDATMDLGSLRTQTLREIWNGPAYLALREAELAGQNTNKLCVNCTEAPGFERDPSRPMPIDAFL